MGARVGEMLVEAGIIDELQLQSALGHQQAWGGRIGRILVDKGFVPENIVVQTISRAMKLPAVNLDQVEADAHALAKVKLEFAKERAVFPCALREGGKTLWLAMADPTDVETSDRIQAEGNVRVRAVVAGEQQILQTIERCYKGRLPTSPSIPAAAKAEEPEGIDLSDVSGVVDDVSLVDALGNRRKVGAQAAPEPPPAAPRRAWSFVDNERLRGVQDGQKQSADVLRVVLDLCVEKGVFSVEDFKRKLGKP